MPGYPGSFIDMIVWDWGDGIRESASTLPVMHVYRGDGVYTITVEVIQSEIGAPERGMFAKVWTTVDIRDVSASYTAAPFVPSSSGAKPTQKVVVERTADIDPGMTPYSGPTMPPTNPEPPSAGTEAAATTVRSSPPPAANAGSAVTASAAVTMPVAVQPATTTIAAQPATYASSVATTAAPTDSGLPILFAMGALLAVFGLVVGGIAYRSYVTRRDAPVEIMGQVGPLDPRSTSIAPNPAGGGAIQAPWEGYSPLASDSYDLLARLRRYDDSTLHTGPERTIPLAERLDLSLVPTLPIPAEVKELGPSVGCQVLSVDHLGSAVCLRDPGTDAERLDVMKVEEILRLIEERYEQRWVPRE